MINLVWRTDVHISNNSPRSRNDDWISIVLEKVEQVGKIADEVGALAVIDGGDFFDKKSPQKTPHHLIEKIAITHQSYPCPVYSNVGNHDCIYGDIRFLRQQPLGVLFATGVFKRLYNEHEVTFSDGIIKVRVVGVPYHGTNYDLSRFDIKKKDEDFLVVMGHVLASKRGGSMFEGEDIIKYSDLVDFDADVHCFLPGTKLVDWNGRQVNIESVSGSLSIMGREGPVLIDEIHPIRYISDKVIKLDVEGVPSSFIPGVTKEHPFWVSKDLFCRIPSRSGRRCHPDKSKTSYPCSNCQSPSVVQPFWIGAGEIQKGDYVSIPVPKVPDGALSEPDKARLLGYYLAGGFILLNRKKDPVAGVGFCFHMNETELHEDIARLANKLFGGGIRHHKYPHGECLKIHVYGPEISSFCNENGGRYSFQKELSPWIWSLCRESRIQLLLGWLLGDGHARDSRRYNRTRNEVTGATCSPNMASQIFLLSLSVGLRPFYTIRPGRRTRFPGGYESEVKPSHTLSFYGDDARFLGSLMGVDEPPKVKSTKLSGFFKDGMYWMRVRSVSEMVYNGPVYNIRTSSKEYIAGMLLTHNCFGHWHKDQGIEEISDGKWVVNVGSLTRGSLTQDDMNRKPACVVMGFSKKGISFDVRRLKVKSPKEVFKINEKASIEAREMLVGGFVESLRLELSTNPKIISLEDIIRNSNVPQSVKEKAILYMEDVS